MDFELLASLGSEDRQALLSLARRRRFDRNEVLFHEGDPGDSLHLLARGRVAVRVTTPLGEIATLVILGTGDYFGELAVVASGARNATVVALEKVETLTLHRDQFEELRLSHPAVDQILLLATIGEVRRLSHQLLEALYLPVEKRVFRRLLDLVALYEQGDGGATVIPLTQEDLAGLAGTTRPTVNKILRTAEAEGAVKISRGKLEVVDTTLLARRGR